jgi:hypothetical protein
MEKSKGTRIAEAFLRRKKSEILKFCPFAKCEIRNFQLKTWMDGGQLLSKTTKPRVTSSKFQKLCAILKTSTAPGTSPQRLYYH